MKEIIQIENLNKQELREIVHEVVLSILKTQSKDRPDSQFMSVKQTYVFLGISRSTLYVWIEKGLIEPFYIGDKPYFIKEEINAMMQERSKSKILVKISAGY